MKVVRGKRIRVTKVDRCGMPIAGPGSTLVTKGFVTVNIKQEMKDAEELEQTNADGEICVADRTAPQVKAGSVEIQLCDVDTELLNLVTGMPMVLDHANDPVGFRVAREMDVDQGFALELWTGTAGDDCETPTTDDILTAKEPVFEYGYFLVPAVTEATIGDIEVGASVSTFTVTGRAVSAPRWGRGPYNVVATDAKNTPGRLLAPIEKDQYIHVQRTSIAPPAVTDGAVALTLPTPFYGAEAAATAPTAPAVEPEGAGV